MKKIWCLPLGICTLLALFAQESLADYGEKFLSVRCDAKAGVFEVEPRIIWNEELDGLQSSLKNGGGRTQRGNVQLFNFEMLGSKVETTCKISDAEFRVLVTTPYDSKLQLFESNGSVVFPVIGDVWDFCGYVFKVRYTSAGGWEEICGREESDKRWQVLNRKRMDTNCREPLKNAPNNSLQPTTAR